MDTNETLRQRALRLVTLGCSQKILASKMGMPAGTFSRWLNQKGIGPVSVSALDGFNRYVHELREALSDIDVHQQPIRDEGGGLVTTIQRSLAATTQHQPAAVPRGPRHAPVAHDQKKGRRSRG